MISILYLSLFTRNFELTIQTKVLNIENNGKLYLQISFLKYLTCYHFQ